MEFTEIETEERDFTDDNGTRVIPVLITQFKCKESRKTCRIKPHMWYNRQESVRNVNWQN